VLLCDLKIHFLTKCILFVFFLQQLVQAGMGTHFPATGYSPTTPAGVGPESLSVAVAVKNAINDPLLSLKSDANTQQQPNSSPLVRLL
jgi:hypothetical protein